MLVECIARRLVEAGARVVVGDSSGGAYTRAYMNNVYRVTGMTEACKASGAELNDDFGFRRWTSKARSTVIRKLSTFF